MKCFYRGRCHCGAVQFESGIDWSAGTLQCRCPICVTTRTWGVVVAPGAFRLTQGHEALSVYRFGNRHVAHCFCRHCGVHPFAHGHSAEFGGAFDVVHLNCLVDLHWPDVLAAPQHVSNECHSNFTHTLAKTWHA